MLVDRRVAAAFGDWYGPTVDLQTALVVLQSLLVVLLARKGQPLLLGDFIVARLDQIEFDGDVLDDGCLAATPLPKLHMHIT